MKLAFLELSPNERLLYFQEAAARRGIVPVILEKDFWVSWLLSILFNSRFAPELVFKGGTSLSKVFGVIDRFSEDIDLSVSPAFLGLEEPGRSRTQADKWMTAAEATCTKLVRDVLCLEFENLAAGILGERPGGWFEFVTDPMTHSPVLHFRYPTLLPAGFDYIRRTVKLEFGSLTEQQPVGRHPIRPWIADVLGPAFADWNCEVVSLEVERTFWEKATILHAEYHRPEAKPIPDRFFRHYADTAALCLHELGKAAIEQQEIRDRVVAWKSRFFGSKWARYDLAKPGTFRVVPSSARRSELQRDYRAMRDMYLSEPPKFEAVIDQLSDLESRINKVP